MATKGTKKKSSKAPSKSKGKKDKVAPQPVGSDVTGSAPVFGHQPPDKPGVAQ